MDEVEQKNPNNGFLLGVVLGGIVGAAIAYLAVDDKSALRKNLVKKGKILLDHLDDFKEDAEQKGMQIQKEVVKRIEEVKEEVADKVEQIPETTAAAVETIQKAADKEVARVVKVADKAENNLHQKARKFFLKKGKPVAKK